MHFSSHIENIGVLVLMPNRLKRMRGLKFLPFPATFRMGDCAGLGEEVDSNVKRSHIKLFVLN